MDFAQRSYRDKLGGIVIQSLLGPAVDRKGFEKLMFPAIDVGLEGWQRAHAQGGGTGFESAHAIRYAPEEVNQSFQRLGIERYIRELIATKPDDVDLWLTTVTTTHPRSLRLKEIQYRLDELPKGQVRRSLAMRLLEAEIIVSDDRVAPRVGGSVTPYLLDESKTALNQPAGDRQRANKQTDEERF
jgi:hypothetical protein